MPKPIKAKCGIEEGLCPNCGEELEYGDLDVEGESVYYDVNCEGCKFSGHEYYTLTFDGMTNEDGTPIVD